MITAITYGDERYDLSCYFNLKTAKIFGKADEVKRFSRNDIESDFLEKNERIFREKRGGGLWVWKPYIIYKSLLSIDENDYLMYLDAGAIYVDSIYKLIRQIESDKTDMLCSSSILPNMHWCKRKLIEKYVKKIDVQTFFNSSLPEAGYLLIKKNNHSLSIIKEWLDLCQIYENISDETNNEFEFFKEHRHDQSVFSVVLFNNNIKPYKGLSGRSEYKYYYRYDDGEFFGYTKNELLKLSYTEKERDNIKKSSYGRIVINTRIDTNNYILFYLKFVKKLVAAFLVDSIFAFAADLKLKRYEKSMIRSKDNS